MRKIMVGLLVCTALAFYASVVDACNKEDDYYIVIHDMQCQVYIYCDGTIGRCPKGEAFDIVSKKCLNSSLVYCPEPKSLRPSSPIARRSKHPRSKRQISINFQRIGSTILESIVAFADPLIAKVLPAVRPAVIGREDTVKNKIILPIIFTMLEDHETRRDLRRIFFATKEAFQPILSRMMRQQAFGNRRHDTLTHIPKEVLVASKEMFNTQARPLIRKVAEKHWSMMLNTAAEHTDVLLDALDNLEAAAEPYAAELKQRFGEFMEKHGSLFFNRSSSDDVQTYSVQDIKEDLIPIARLLMDIFIDKMSREPRSVFSSFFSRNSIFYTLLNADRAVDSVYQLDPRSRNSPRQPFVPAFFNVINSFARN